MELGADYVAENYAWEAAAWFWSENVHGLFEGGKTPTVEDITEMVNGGATHLVERKEGYDKLTAYDC